MLAVSLSWLTWLYTYKKDAWKFWFGLGLGTVSIGLICIYIIKAFEDAMNMVDQAMAGSLSETQLVGEYIRVVYLGHDRLSCGFWYMGVVHRGYRH